MYGNVCPNRAKAPKMERGDTWLHAKDAVLKIWYGVNQKKATGIYLSLQQSQQNLLTKISPFLLHTAAKKSTAKVATRVFCLTYNQEAERE